MYEKFVSECKKFQFLIQNVVGVNVIVISQIEYDNFITDTEGLGWLLAIGGGEPKEGED